MGLKATYSFIHPNSGDFNSLFNYSNCSCHHHVQFLTFFMIFNLEFFIIDIFDLFLRYFSGYVISSGPFSQRGSQSYWGQHLDLKLRWAGNQSPIFRSKTFQAPSVVGGFVILITVPYRQPISRSNPKMSLLYFSNIGRQNELKVCINLNQPRQYTS